MGSESMNDIFHSIMKSAPNVTIYHLKLYDFKTDFWGSGIIDLCSKISWMRGVGWPDEKNISDLDQKLVISTRSVFLTHPVKSVELSSKTIST